MSEFTPWPFRRVRAKPGRRGWVIADMRRKDYHSLPRGLVDGTVVTVVTSLYGVARVQTEGGLHFEIHATYNLDMGRNYCIDGEWVREDDPRVLDAWERCVAELRTLPNEPGPHGRQLREDIMKVEILLARHGRQCAA